MYIWYNKSDSKVEGRLHSNENIQYRRICTAGVFEDRKHIKANVNIKKVIKKVLSQAAKVYEKQLMNEINEDRDEHIKKLFNEPKPQD